MSRFKTLGLLATLSWGCSDTKDQARDQKIEALERRVTSLERRLGAPDKSESSNRRKGRTRAATDEAPAQEGTEASATEPPRAKRAREVSGEQKARVTSDAEVEVYLLKQRRKFPLPADLVEGTYSVMAVFEPDRRAVRAGLLEISGDTPVVIQCDVDAQTCGAR